MRLSRDAPLSTTKKPQCPTLKIYQKQVKLAHLFFQSGTMTYRALLEAWSEAGQGLRQRRNQPIVPKNIKFFEKWWGVVGDPV
jgi:hypothetical protein